jgi:hypothetical protein
LFHARFRRSSAVCSGGVTEKTHLDNHDLLLREVVQCEFVDSIAQDALLNQQHVATTLDNGLQQIQNVLEKGNNMGSVHRDKR